MTNLMIEKLKTLTKPRVLFYSDGRRFEGLVLSVDDTYLELYDDLRVYRRFIKIDTITDLEVKA